MIQQLRKFYNDCGVSLDYAGMIREAENAQNKSFVVAPNDPSLFNPVNMEEAVINYCEKTGQGKPKGTGETVMAVYNGLVAEYAAALDDLASLQQKNIQTLHMVGGGIQDTLLCRLTAKKTQKRVEAGPVEASTLGNIITQMIGLGVIDNLTQGREIIRQSYAPVIY